MSKPQQLTRRTFVEPDADAPEHAGWRFVEHTLPVRRRPSLSWRLRH
jgi:hypothetical protein